MIILNRELDKKNEHSLSKKVGDPTKVHTHYLLPSNIPPINKHNPFVPPTAAAFVFCLFPEPV